MFKLGIITDEVSQDFKVALDFAKKYKLDGVEIRSVWGKDPFELNEADICKMKDMLNEYNLEVCGIAAPFYKCDYFKKEDVSIHIDGLKRCIKWANILGAKIIRGFDFWKADVSLEERARMYELPAKLALDAGITIVIEYDPSVNSTNCEKVAELVRAIKKSNIKALYDPGNDIYSPNFEVPYPDGYKFIEDIFSHIHIKDAICNNGNTIATPVGKGEVKYAELFRELLEKKYKGYVVLETHYKPQYTISDDVLKQPKGDDISFMGEIASSESMENLKEIIKKCGVKI